MQLKIDKVKIQNFRNITDLEIEFKNGINEIQAENGKGKTNTLSAIMWCMFGKNIYETKSFPISPIIDGEEKNDIRTNVTIYLNDNYVISRTYYKRTTTLQTGYLIDGIEQLVDTTQTNYKKDFAKKFTDEETYKSLSNINYIPNLHWKDLKNLIFDLIGGITDDEVLLNDDFNLIEEQIRLMGINSTQEALKSSDSTLNEQIKAKETEYQTLINTKDKYVSENKDVEILKTRKELLENKIEEIIKNMDENLKISEQIQKKEKLISDKEREISINVMKRDSLLSSISNLKQQYDLLATDVDAIRQKEINYIENNMEQLLNRMHELKEQNINQEKLKGEYRHKGEELKSKEVKIENDKCSTCGQQLPEEIINSTLQLLKDNQMKELEMIKQHYDDCKKVIEINENEIKETNVKYLELKKELEISKTKEIKSVSENDKQKEIRVLREQQEIEVQKLDNEFLPLQTELNEIKNIKVQELIPVEDMKPIREELDSINEQLATTITLEKINDDIEKSGKDLKQLKENKNLVKDKLLQVTKFNNIKAELLRNKAKSNFKIADFKTKEYTQDGTEVETFKICVNGIDYQELNTGMKILVAIDLITGIQNLKDIHVPVICDNVENVTSEIKIDNTQLIIARAVKDIERIEVK